MGFFGGICWQLCWQYFAFRGHGQQLTRKQEKKLKKYVQTYRKEKSGVKPLETKILTKDTKQMIRLKQWLNFKQNWVFLFDCIDNAEKGTFLADPTQLRNRL